MKINGATSSRDAFDIQVCLRNTITPEANHLLIEPPGPPKPPGDFGWFCREHAFICSILCRWLGYELQIVRGDVSIVQPSRVPLSSAGHEFKHWWCTSNFAEVIDISLNLRHLHSPLSHFPPIIGIGTNGPFSIIVSHHKNANEIPRVAPIIAYSPIEMLPHTAEDLAENPQLLLDTDEAARIAARCCIHISQLIRGQVESYINGFDQASALASIRCRYPNARKQIQKLVTTDSLRVKQ
jgi:hypothetical protein